MVNKRQNACRIKNELREEDCSERAVEAINRNLTISINGTLKQKTRIQSLVGMSANKRSVSFKPNVHPYDQGLPGMISILI